MDVALLLVSAAPADDGRRARLAGDVLPHSICSVPDLRLMPAGDAAGRVNRRPAATRILDQQRGCSWL